MARRAVPFLLFFFFFSIRRVDWWHLHAHAPPEVAIKCNQIGNRISNQRFCPRILLYARHDFPSPKLCRANIFVLFAFLVPSFFERRTRVTSAFAYFKTDQNNVEISKREWWRDSKKIIEITSLIYRFIINLVLFCKYTCFSLFSFFFFTKIIYRLFAFWYREFDMRSIVVFSTRSLLRFIIINHLLRLPFKSVSLFDNCYRQSISDLLRSY